MLDFRDFSFTHAGAEAKALDTLNLHVDRGEFVAVIGANGSGKTSLCHALTGVIPHLYQGTAQGEVRVDNRNTAEDTVAQLSASVALVMQKPEHQLSGARFTVREEIAFSLENQGVPRKAIKERVKTAMQKAGLSDLADCIPQRLSGGQLQRVVMAAALVTDTPILVLDEPTTFLDPRNTLQTFATLKALSREGKTIILAEQRLEHIALHADRVLALHHGAIVLDGPPESVLASPMLQAIGLGWNRFTQTARLAIPHGLWPQDRVLPATLAATLDGLERD